MFSFFVFFSVKGNQSVRSFLLKKKRTKRKLYLVFYKGLCVRPLFAQTIFKRVILSLSNFWMEECAKPSKSKRLWRAGISKQVLLSFLTKVTMFRFAQLQVLLLALPKPKHCTIPTKLLLLNVKTTKIQRRSRFASLALYFCYLAKIKFDFVAVLCFVRYLFATSRHSAQDDLFE